MKTPNNWQKWMAKEGTAGQLAAVRYVAEHVRLAATCAPWDFSCHKKVVQVKFRSQHCIIQNKRMYEISQLSSQNLSSYLICHLANPSKSPIYCTSYQANLVSLGMAAFQSCKPQGFHRESFREVILIYMTLPGLVARIRLYLVYIMVLQSNTCTISFT